MEQLSTFLETKENTMEMSFMSNSSETLNLFLKRLREVQGQLEEYYNTLRKDKGIMADRHVEKFIRKIIRLVRVNMAGLSMFEVVQSFNDTIGKSNET
jgi:hypothetical protein